MANSVATDYGLDLTCTDDLDPRCSVTSGRRIVAEAVYRRLITPRGRLIDDPEYGTDITDWINDDFSASDIASLGAAIQSECLKDERVAEAEVSVEEPPGGTGAYAITISLTELTGTTFDLVLSVSDVTVDLLRVD